MFEQPERGAKRRAGPTAIEMTLLLIFVGLAMSCSSGPASGARSDNSPADREPASPTTVTALVSMPPADLPPGDDAVVTRVVDGDTLVVSGDGVSGDGVSGDGVSGDVVSGEVKVRLIGVDTPETRHPDLGVQCYGKAATGFTEQLVPPGTGVRLVFDVDRTDRYGRTLAYVYRLDDGVFLNGELVRQGFAQVSTVPPNVAHADEFVAWQRAARDDERGLWNACLSGGGDGGSSNVDDDSRSRADDGACDPAYPDHCLPSPPPDLDCADVDGRNITVRPPDPHNLDGDGDGTACGG